MIESFLLGIRISLGVLGFFAPFLIIVGFLFLVSWIDHHVH